MVDREKLRKDVQEKLIAMTALHEELGTFYNNTADEYGIEDDSAVTEILYACDALQIAKDKLKKCLKDLSEDPIDKNIQRKTGRNFSER